jgi:hypothetical protein
MYFQINYMRLFFLQSMWLKKIAGYFKFHCIWNLVILEIYVALHLMFQTGFYVRVPCEIYNAFKESKFWK